ncbi:MAG TPA: hypothetical protein VF867_07405 [Arthrobacter sp.]
MNQDQIALQDANFINMTGETRELFHEQKRREAMSQLTDGDTRQVTVELDIAEDGDRDDIRELGTISIQDAVALTYFLEYHRDYDYSRAASVRVEDFGPLGFDQMSEDSLYPAPHDGLTGKAERILDDLRIQLDWHWNSEECFLQYRIH